MKFFISYVYEDRAFKSQLADWSAQKRLGSWEAVCETEDMRQDGKKAIQNHLNPLIKSCEAVVLLVGNNSHNHPWLDYEVQNAKSAGKAVVCVRLPNTTGGSPVGVQEPATKFTPQDILNALGKG